MRRGGVDQFQCSLIASFLDPKLVDNLSSLFLVNKLSTKSLPTTCGVKAAGLVDCRQALAADKAADKLP
ncbi:hypothetical protein Y032_0182g895 [Ancylostoma ceylanicum]|uniref:Uncharacterized protein n=1 Tax=Ancylostoma ceylanicum TaxID=53326 RepID=A0A016SRU7_9BILA|nr:hypothetical protein Y032_0182g895 [Ancylostoma ceylanicum]